jgi:hypothetical protein
MSERVIAYLDTVRLKGVMGQILRQLNSADNQTVSVTALQSRVGVSQDSLFSNIYSAQEQGWVQLDKGLSDVEVKLTPTGVDIAKSIIG